MSNQKIIRAWKDAEYRASLTEAERTQLPEHPAGPIEVPEDALATVVGGFNPNPTRPGACTWGVRCDSY